MVWLKFDIIAKDIAERRELLIKQFYYKRMSDSEIAEALGLGKTTVGEVRRRLGLPGHQFSGDEKWRDPEAVRAQISERNKGMSNKQRAHKKGVPVDGYGKPRQGAFEGYVGALRRKNGGVNSNY